MAALFEIREKIITACRQYESLLMTAVRFLAVLLATMYINGRIGYMDTLTSPLLMLIIALIGTLIPGNVTVAILAVIVLLHLYTLAMEAAAVGAVLFLLILLLYYRFSPKDSMLMLLYPASFTLGIPYVMPIAGGLLYSAGSALTCVVAIVFNSFISFVADNEKTLGQVSEEADIIGRFRFLIDGIMQNKVMIVMAAAAAVTALVVYLIRRLAVRYAWYIAIAVGAILQLIILLVGDMSFNIGLSVGRIFAGVLISVLIAAVLGFFLFNLDYSRIENTQFEDDDYYYYVKAVPKITVKEAKRTVKKISMSRHTPRKKPAETPVAGRPEPEDEYDDGYGDFGDDYFADSSMEFYSED